jgi:hypothetical protein
MAVWVLVAKNGPKYEPDTRITTGTIFTDVPITHGAVHWIEDMYRQGITNGCRLEPFSGALYFCPTANETRYDAASHLVKAFKMQCGAGDGCASVADPANADLSYPSSVDGMEP